MCCWYLILTTPTGPAMRPNDPNGPTNVDIAKPQILISWQGARLEVLWCLRNGWIWSRHSNWKQWQKANQQLHRSQTSPNFLLHSLSPSPLIIYTICIYLIYFFHCASIIFPWSPASSQHPRRQARQAPGVAFGPFRCTFRSSWTWSISLFLRFFAMTEGLASLHATFTDEGNPSSRWF